MHVDHEPEVRRVRVETDERCAQRTVRSGHPAAHEGSHSLDVGGQQYCVGGDVITSIDGHAVATLDDLQERLSSFAAGDKLQLGITGGDGSRRTVTVTVGSIPAQRQPLATGC